MLNTITPFEYLLLLILFAVALTVMRTLFSPSCVLLEDAVAVSLGILKRRIYTLEKLPHLQRQHAELLVRLADFEKRKQARFANKQRLADEIHESIEYARKLS